MEMKLETEIKKEYRNWENWIDQIFNIFHSLIWSIGSLLILLATLVGLSCIVLVLAHDGSNFTFLEFQAGFKVIVISCSIVSAVIAFVFQFPKKVRNVFDEMARGRLNRYNSIKHDFDSQIDTTDGLLLKYGLITEKDIEARKFKKEYK